MKPVNRDIEKHLMLAAKSFPATVVTGPRRSGKTYLLKRLLPAAEYYLFEDPDIISRFRQDPQGFLDGVKPPVILDEIQNLPEVFNYVRSRIDAHPRKMGQWFLTGSQEAGLMRNVTESMAGRAAVLQLRPLSTRESPKVNLFRGAIPRLWRGQVRAAMVQCIRADLSRAGRAAGDGRARPRDVSAVPGLDRGADGAIAQQDDDRRGNHVFRQSLPQVRPAG
ncbi:MAG: AAA family ATPase [Richelia sp. CSU_2_1]|nr:AAA family ATPase [Richelia sp. CSU_2_1]